MEQPKEARPVSWRQRRYFRYRLDEAMRLSAECRQQYLQENGWTLGWLRQMAEVEAVRYVELTPEDGQQLLDQLKAESRLRFQRGTEPRRRKRNRP
jgi:hypothetical protein